MPMKNALPTTIVPTTRGVRERLLVHKYVSKESSEWHWLMVIEGTGGKYQVCTYGRVVRAGAALTGILDNLEEALPF
jgi:hypothetical protein